MSQPILLLDGASMWFRSYFGVPSSITAPDGRPVNAVRGFIDNIAALVTQHRPGRLVVCLDLDWRPQWRVDLIPSYKAHRVLEEHPDGEPDIEEVPDDLTPQVAMIMELLDAFGIATAGAAGFEADDVLGTLATREQTDPAIVVSGDRDLLQLASDDGPGIRVFYIGRGLAKAVLYGPAEVAETYGVPLDRAGAAYAELALLRGADVAFTYMSACIVVAQLVMVGVAALAARYVDTLGRRPLFLIAFAVLPVRGLFYTFTDDPIALLAIQSLDGIGAGLFGVLFPVMIADLTRGTGHTNLALGASSMIWGGAASLSFVLAGTMASLVNYDAAFICLAFIAAAGGAVFAFAVPETRGVVPAKSGAVPAVGGVS